MGPLKAQHLSTLPRSTHTPVVLRGERRAPKLSLSSQPSLEVGDRYVAFLPKMTEHPTATAAQDLCDASHRKKRCVARRSDDWLGLTFRRHRIDADLLAHRSVTAHDVAAIAFTTFVMSNGLCRSSHCMTGRPHNRGESIVTRRYESHRPALRFRRPSSGRTARPQTA